MACLRTNAAAAAAEVRVECLNSNSFHRTAQPCCYERRALKAFCSSLALASVLLKTTVVTHSISSLSPVLLPTHPGFDCNTQKVGPITFQTTFYWLFPSWICDINPTDLGGGAALRTPIINVGSQPPRQQHPITHCKFFFLRIGILVRKSAETLNTSRSEMKDIAGKTIRVHFKPENCLPSH